MAVVYVINAYPTRKAQGFQPEINGRGVSRNEFSTLRAAVERVSRCSSAWRFRVIKIDIDETRDDLNHHSQWWGAHDNTDAEDGWLLGTTEQAREWLGTHYGELDPMSGRVTRKHEQALIENAIDAITNTKLKETDMTTAPLNIKRTEIIKTLKAAIAADEKKRQDEREKEAQDQQAAYEQTIEALAAISYDRFQDLVTLLVDHQWLQETKDGLVMGEGLDEDYGHTATRTDPREKLVRVLEISTDTTVEVKPDDDLWRYL